MVAGVLPVEYHSAADSYLRTLKSGVEVDLCMTSCYNRMFTGKIRAAGQLNRFIHVTAKAVECAWSDVRSSSRRFRNSNMGGADAKTIAFSTTPTYPGQGWSMNDQKNFIYGEVKERLPCSQSIPQVYTANHLDEARASMLFRNYMDLCVRIKDGDSNNNAGRVLTPYNPAAQIATVPIFFTLSSREASAATEEALTSEMGLIDTDSPYPDDAGFVDYYFGHIPDLKGKARDHALALEVHGLAWRFRVQEPYFFVF